MENFNFNSKKFIYTFLVVCGFILLYWFSGQFYVDVDAGEIAVIQSPISGDLKVRKEAGFAWRGGGKVTIYRKSNQYWFSSKEDKEGKPIDVKWNDGGHASISGSIRYDMPIVDGDIVKIHSIFGSQRAIEKQLVETNIVKSIYMTGPLMSSKESYAEKRNDLIYYIEDQASKGVYKTVQRSIKEKDLLTSEERTVTRVEILMDSNNTPKRQEKSPIEEYGMRLYNISITSITYDANVEKQIQTQQQAIMNVQTAMANSKKAEQDALTIAKEGEAKAAEAKWKQEVLKAELVTKAESEKKVAELEAEKRKNVAALDVQTAKLEKERAILEGQGEAEKKKLIMVADGALTQKLDAYIKVQGMWATAFAEFKGNLVPQIQTGGNGVNGNSASQFMDLMMIKAAKDLQVDFNTKK